MPLLTRDVEVHLGGILSVLVRNHHLVPALVVGLRLTDAERDAVGLAVRVDLVATAFIDLGEALEELDRGWWVALHDEVDVAVLVCRDWNETLLLASSRLYPERSEYAATIGHRYYKRSKRNTLQAKGESPNQPGRSPSTAVYFCWTSTMDGGPGWPMGRSGVLGLSIFSSSWTEGRRTSPLGRRRCWWRGRRRGRGVAKDGTLEPCHGGGTERSTRKVSGGRGSFRGGGRKRMAARDEEVKGEKITKDRSGRGDFLVDLVTRR